MARTFSRPCPQCTRTVTWPDSPTYPFCSERCRLIDLGEWASEGYRIPVEELADEDVWTQSTSLEADEEPY